MSDLNFSNKILQKFDEPKLISWFRTICKLEAVSWALLFSAMIWIRYQPQSVFAIVYISVVGSVHGLFWTLYLLMIVPVRKIFKWDDEDFVFALIAAFFPFATIWIEKKLAHFNRE